MMFSFVCITGSSSEQVVEAKFFEKPIAPRAGCSVLCLGVLIAF